MPPKSEEIAAAHRLAHHRASRLAQLRQHGQAAAAQAADLEEKFTHVWRFTARDHADGGHEFLWGVAFEVINLRRFAAWAAK